MNRKKFSDFVRYDNTLPLLLIVGFIGASSTFALSNDSVQQALLQPTTKVISIDNSYIANVNLSNFSPKVLITAVQEDMDSYIVTYSFETIELVDAVWKPTTISRTLKVDKSVLGKYKDLGLFVTEELKQVIDQEKARLLATQEIERKNISAKVVATEYSGLIGQLMDDKTETLPGYVPVVTETPEINVIETPTPVTPSAPDVPTAPIDNSIPSVPPQNTNPVETPTPNNVNVQIVGDAFVNLNLGNSYIDKGVFVNNTTLESIETKVNGEVVTTINIDTSTTSTYKIEYKVTTSAGIFNLERNVSVSSPTIEPIEVPAAELPVLPAEVPVQAETPAPIPASEPVTTVAPEPTIVPTTEPTPIVETPSTP